MMNVSPLDPASQDVPPVAALMPALNFGPDDLAANRQGRFSDNQLERLRGLQRRAVLIAVVGFMILALLATIFLFLAQQDGSLVLTFVGIALTICNAIMTAMFARHWYRISADIRAQQVDHLDGVLERTIRRAGNSSQYFVGIEGVRFPVKKEPFTQFRHEQPYSLYYAPNAHILLSAEPHS